MTSLKATDLPATVDEATHQLCQSEASEAVIEGSLEVKLLTIWTDGKAEVAESERRREEERRSEKRKSQKKEDAGARKRQKSRDSLCFSNDLWFRRVEK